MHSFTTAGAIAAAVAILPSVSAHGHVQGIMANGKYTPNTTPNWIYGTKPVSPGWYAKDQDNGFVAPDSYGSPDIICHKEATPGANSVEVAAGSKMTLFWDTWPVSHHGPVTDYLARCPGDCTAVDKTRLNFFPIDKVGLLDGSVNPGNWASDTLIANNNSWTVTIPADLAPGYFVLRHEIIGLHSAGNANGAQSYPQCINVHITGSGTKRPCDSGAPCAKGTALYKATDAGILINIYQSLSSYTIPGPAVWSGWTKSKRFSQIWKA
ncbi:hypothetical protein LTR95_016086 [Oleoguttula sp. CCFEE 5521]